MKIRYENTIDDIIAFRHHANNAPQIQKRLRIVLIIPATFFLILGILAAIEEQDAIYLAGGVVIGLAWAGLLWLFIRRRFSASLRRLRIDDSVRNLPCWYELELADGALVERTDCGSHASALENVTEIASSDSHTFIYIGSGAAYVIPSARSTANIGVGITDGFGDTSGHKEVSHAQEVYRPAVG